MATLNVLVEKGADVRRKNKHGDTAMHFAAAFGNSEATEFLLSSGVNFFTSDHQTFYSLF